MNNQYNNLYYNGGSGIVAKFQNNPLVKCNSKLTNLIQQFIVGGLEEVQMYIVETLGTIVIVTL
jgi:hypothetical protein